MSELDEATYVLGENYAVWKYAEKEKNKSKDRFFEAVTEELKQEVPAQIFEQIQAPDETAAKDLAQKKFPRFRVLAVFDSEDGSYRVALEENPDLRPFTYINQEIGMVFQRSVVEGSPMLDDERLKAEAPALWKEVTYIPEPERKLKPLEDLSPNQLASLSEFMYAAKPTTKLIAPRKAKAEELEYKQ